MLWVGVLPLQLWALVDCISPQGAGLPRRQQAHQAHLGVAHRAGLGMVLISQSVTFLLSFIAIIVSSVYLADVRPAVREISGPSRW